MTSKKSKSLLSKAKKGQCIHCGNDINNEVEIVGFENGHYKINVDCESCGSSQLEMAQIVAVCD